MAFCKPDLARKVSLGSKVTIIGILFTILVGYTSISGEVGTDLNVGSSVFLFYQGQSVPWPQGQYGSCLIGPRTTDCIANPQACPTHNNIGNSVGSSILLLNVVLIVMAAGMIYLAITLFKKDAMIPGLILIGMAVALVVGGLILSIGYISLAAVTNAAGNVLSC